MPEIIQYRNRCIGCGACYEIQPACWRLSKKDGKATLVGSVGKNNIYSRVISPAQLELTNEVILACPVKIIQVNVKQPAGLNKKNRQ